MDLAISSDEPWLEPTKSRMTLVGGEKVACTCVARPGGDAEFANMPSSWEGGQSTQLQSAMLMRTTAEKPDTFLSLGSARRGDDSGAVSNAFGSNILDICSCLSIPLLVSSYLRGWDPVPLVQDGKPLVGLVGLRVLLRVLSPITLGILWHKHHVTRTKAFMLIGLYHVFIAYAVVGSMGLVAL